MVTTPQTDELLEKRIGALGGIMKTAGRSQEHIDSISELARLAAQRKELEAAWNPETDPVFQREKYWREVEKQEAESDEGQIDSWVDLVDQGQITNWQQIPANVRSKVVERAGSRAIAMKDLDKEAQAQALIGTIADLKKAAREAGVGNKFNPFSSAHERFNLIKGLLGQTIAKMYEGGRLSDEDRRFYQSQILQISPYGFSKKKEKILDELQKQVLRKVGYEEGLPESPENMVSPTTTNVPAATLEGWQEAGGVKFRLKQ